MSAIDPVPAAPGTAPPEPPLGALYRAALGPVQVEHHLQAFDRFDAAGLDRPRWNALAAWLTLPWLIHRRLWRIAAAYLLLVAVAAGVLLGLGWGRWPAGVLVGLSGVLAVVAVAVPGLFADAWLHGQVRQAILAAVGAAPSLHAAAETLQQRAPSRERWRWVLVSHGVLLAGASVMGALALRGPLAEEIAAPAAPVPVVVAAAEPPPAPHAPPEPPVPPVPAPEPPPATEPAVTEPLPLPVAAPSGAYAVNVGLFTDPANAERALERLSEAGVPAQRQTLETARGPRVRVRAGPWSSRAQAEQAAERIRALGLEAQVFKAG